jgi:hypothetical protein
MMLRRVAGGLAVLVVLSGLLTACDDPEADEQPIPIPPAPTTTILETTTTVYTPELTPDPEPVSSDPEPVVSDPELVFPDAEPELSEDDFIYPGGDLEYPEGELALPEDEFIYPEDPKPVFPEGQPELPEDELIYPEVDPKPEFPEGESELPEDEFIYPEVDPGSGFSDGEPVVSETWDVYVGDFQAWLEPQDGYWSVHWQTLIVGGDWYAMPNATVTVEISGPGGSATGEATTGAESWASWMFYVYGPGAYNLGVVDVVGPGMTYTPDLNQVHGVVVEVSAE